MPWRLLVIDGADMRQAFPLIQSGRMTVGSSRKLTDICLHDLYVSRTHCQLEVADDQITVNDLDNSGGTFVNGQKVKQHDLHQGDVLRVGNSHLRLEPSDEAAPPKPVEPPKAAAPAPTPADSAHAANHAHGKLPTLPAEKLPELVGHTLGHYELASVLGQGHHGIVFRAKDLKTQHTVALKVLGAEFPANETEMQTFVNTMKARLPLRHDHLVNSLGAGKASHYCWMALEYIEGESLLQTLERIGQPGKTAWQHALRMAIHLARALDFLHQHHLFHGNITPKNVLCRLSDKHVKLGDLMLNKALEGSALQQARMESKLLAEMPYLSPEQIDPDAFVDDLTDIYSLGAVVYARLTGKPPYQAETPEETLELIAGGELVKPRKHQQVVPEPVENAIIKMLSRHQEDRYQTPAELLAELVPFAEEQEVAI
jgi:serine/threonine protein kinase